MKGLGGVKCPDGIFPVQSGLSNIISNTNCFWAAGLRGQNNSESGNVHDASGFVFF